MADDLKSEVEISRLVHKPERVSEPYTNRGAINSVLPLRRNRTINYRPLRAKSGTKDLNQ